jgi:hypothetical protein
VKKKEGTTTTAIVPVEPVHRMELSRDELYRIVNACYHAHVELAKSPMFAIHNRGNAYGKVAARVDAAYIRLIEHGYDAEFDVQFFLKAKKVPGPRE